MKTTPFFVRLFAGFLLVCGFQYNSMSQEKQLLIGEGLTPMFFSYTLNQPVGIDPNFPIQNWMYCDNEFEKFRYMIYPLDCWLLEEVPANIPLTRDLMALKCWMWGDCNRFAFNDVPIMEWMFDFEPMIVDVLMDMHNHFFIENWMYDTWDVTENLIPYENSIDLKDGMQIKG